MSTVLESIIEGVKEDVAARRVSAAQLAEQIEEAPKVRDARAALSKLGINLIAEIKRASPSKGVLANIADPAKLATAYVQGGASVISVLTEERRFKGSISDFKAVRDAVDIPLLRKDFIVTEYQVMESRAIGADLQLLIVAALSDTQLRDFYQMTAEMRMNSLIEVHNEEELERAVKIGAKIIGINSRNLKNLEIDPLAFEKLLPMIPNGVIRVAESGISSRADVEAIAAQGGNAILVGETLVKAGDPAVGISTLLGL
jgi:indole-3-glycerol phosphate synthase